MSETVIEKTFALQGATMVARPILLAEDNEDDTLIAPKLQWDETVVDN